MKTQLVPPSPKVDLIQITMTQTEAKDLKELLGLITFYDKHPPVIKLIKELHGSLSLFV
jgi:hypothetical protein